MGDPVRAMGRDERSIKTLAPLLARTLRQNGIAPQGRLATFLKAARVIESTHARAYGGAVREVLEVLVRHGIPSVVLKGAAFGEMLYGDPALRHAGDLDVLLHEDDLLRAAEVLQSRGLRRADRRLDRGHHHLTPLVTRSGLNVELHRRLSLLYERIDTGALWARCLPARIAGVDTQVLSPVDNLLHVCVHTIGCRTSRNLRWACDAWLLLGRLGVGDWEILTDTAPRSGIALPLAMTLGYLAQELGAPVPEAVLGRLREEAARTDASGRSAAVFGARCSLALDARGILDMPGGWRPRLLQLGWRIMPPPRHVRWSFGVTRWWLVSMYYPYRFFRFAADPGRHVGLDR